jgi:hypothetical protein
MKSNCNNCGKMGHQYGTCRQPIVSCGIILVTPGADGGWKYLMVCRKNSFGYTDYIHTRFASSNSGHIKRLVDEMTLSEKENLRTQPFEWLWQDMWGGNTGLAGSPAAPASRGIGQSLLHHKGRFENIHPSVLDSALKTSSTQWEIPEWEFPKGQRMFNEKDISCALREFEEETGISRMNISVVENLSPFEEIFIGSDHKPYKYRYFLAYSPTEICTNDFQRSEISKMMWKTADQCCECIRPYSIEKKSMVKTIDAVLTSYRLY